MYDFYDFFLLNKDAFVHCMFFSCLGSIWVCDHVNDFPKIVKTKKRFLFNLAVDVITLYFVLEVLGAWSFSVFLSSVCLCLLYMLLSLALDQLLKIKLVNNAFVCLKKWLDN